jgi:hypothetical protein
MPTFRTTPSLDLQASIRRAVASQNLGPDSEVGADYAAARTAKELSLADKARAEVERIKGGEADRRDPALTAEYAGNVAGIDRPSAFRLAANLRGDLEQPALGDVDDAAAAGVEPSAYRTAAPPSVTPTQTQAFQGALASAFANRLATGNTNAEQLAHSAERFNENSILSKAAEAAAAGDTAGVNLNAAGVLGKKELTPYKTNAQGVTTNEYTGKTTATAGGAAPGMLPGSTGTHLMQDTDSGAKYAVNDKTGRAWKATPDKGWQPVLMTDLPKNLQKFGAGGATQSGREAIFTQRVIQSANQASKDLHNVVQLPMTASTGVFGGRKQGPGLFDATKEVLANKVTSQEVQTYNAMATGFQRTLAAIESAGLMPSGSLTHQMDAVLFKEGDTNLTKMHKLAQTRQIVESGMENVLENPRVSDMEKNHARTIMQRVQQAVPFTHEDLLNMEKAQATNPNATLKDVVGKVGAAAPAAANAKGWKLMVDAKGNKAYVSPDGKNFEAAQ